MNQPHVNQPQTKTGSERNPVALQEARPRSTGPVLVKDAKAKLSFDNSNADFQKDLRDRVDAYFSTHQIKRTANAAMVLKGAFWLTWTFGLLALILAEVLPFPAQVVAWALMGFGFACIGFNIGHDAIHGSYSDKKGVNALLSWTFDMMGASSYTWYSAHNIVHHTYTNVPGHDGDIEPGPVLRFYPRPGALFVHRFQKFYAWPLYTLVALIWVYVKDFEQLLKPDPRSGKYAPLREVGKVFLGKGLHLGLLLALPFALMSAPWWQIAAGYLAMHAVGGFTLSIVFQLAHVVREVEFPQAPQGGRIPQSWAEHELRTTANFGKSALATFICGGLDHQIEHHLMPRICHIHYPQLAPIVAQCAKDHGLPYHHLGTFWDGVRSHYRQLEFAGQPMTAPALGALDLDEASRAAA